MDTHPRACGIRPKCAKQVKRRWSRDCSTSLTQSAKMSIFGVLNGILFCNNMHIIADFGFTTPSRAPQSLQNCRSNSCDHRPLKLVRVVSGRGSRSH
jgi:hypothetical protein